jgi:hypothetical protein
MSRHPKAVQDEAEALAEAQADLESQIEAELDQWDDMYDMHIALGHIPGYSQFGMPEDDDYQYLGPSISNPVENEANMNSSPEEWREFLRKIEEDLGK